MSVLIGITTSFRKCAPANSSEGRVRPSRPEVYLSQALLDHVRLAGGSPVLLPPGGNDDLISWAVTALDGIIVSGGAFDIHPSHYGQEVEARIDLIQDDRSLFELKLIRSCLTERIPLLGICGGMQALAVATGGTLFQDIGTQFSNALEHEQPTDPSEGWHDVILNDEVLTNWYKSKSLYVNSTHHQSVDHTGDCIASAHASDGVIEAIRHPKMPFCVGVQWHPELRNNTLFQALVHHVENSQ